MNRKVTDWQVVDHGVESSSYFQGCGVSFTEYADVATGISDTAREALNDALEQLASGGWDIGPETDARIMADCPTGSESVCGSCDCANKDSDDPEYACCGCERRYFVSVRVR